MKQLKVVQARVDKPQLALIFILIGLFVASFILAELITDMDLSNKQQVAVVPIRGVISIDSAGGFMDGSSTSSSYIVQVLKDLDNDESIHAVVLDINSPGGTPVASREIVEEVKRMEKPVVAVIRETGASGAYWIASSADYVIADPLSITGSVGVIASYLEFSGLLERYNVTHQQLTAGTYKDIGSPLRPLEDEEETLLQAKLNIVREIFIDDVSRNRNLSLEHTQEISSALYYLGSEAYDLGLIDELGGMNEAKTYLLENHEIEADFVYIYAETQLFDILASLSTRHGYAIGQGFTEQMYAKQGGLMT